MKILRHLNPIARHVIFYKITAAKIKQNIRTNDVIDLGIYKSASEANAVANKFANINPKHYIWITKYDSVPNHTRISPYKKIETLSLYENI